MKLSQILQFRRAVLGWYRRHSVDFPWRRTHDPYRILVSEIMLQQTQADRVKVMYPKFLQEFPTVQSLAAAPVARVIRAWSGMGYNRRALYLQRTAHAVVNDHAGEFPRTLGELQALPGIGEYTSRALMVFAFGNAYIAPDVNVLRILRRSFYSVIPDRDRGSRNRNGRGFRLPGRNDITVKELIALGDRIVTAKNAYDINQALMDLGRTICTANNPKSALCPLHEDCAANDPTPRRDKKQEPMFGGVPRRIWRGRIVELVRTNGRVATRALLSHLGLEQEPVTMQWVTDVVNQLHRDGLVRFQNDYVHLP